MPSFHDFSLQPTTRTVLEHMRITEPTPVQAEAIPALLAGHDLVGQSATGSGKTLAYGIPLVERLARDRVVQALVLVPTRELAIQVNTVLSQLATVRRLTTALLVGGRAYGGQFAALRHGAQIVVGTPGRIKDHLDQGTLTLSQVRICVLDEADQMLDSGFGPAIEEILTTTPETRQTALFSATIPEWVEKLEKKFLKDPVKVNITAAMAGPSTIEQIAYQVPQMQKTEALCVLLRSAEGESSLIFGRTKYGVERLGKQLSKLGFSVGTLHGDKSQRAREEVLTAFRQGQVQTLLATDVAARGLDIQGIYQVINYEPPESSELFTHRIGRTGRMGRQGKAISLLAPSDMYRWKRVSRHLGQAVTLERLTLSEEAPAITEIEVSEAPATEERTPSVTQQPEQKREKVSPRPKRARDDGQEAKRDKRKSPLPEQKLERKEERWPERDRKQFSQRQKSDPALQSEYESALEEGMTRRQRERFMGKTRTQEVEAFPKPQRPAAGKVRGGRREVAQQGRAGRTTRQQKARAAAQSAGSVNRRKSRTAPGAQSRRSFASKRAVGR